MFETQSIRRCEDSFELNGDEVRRRVGVILMALLFLIIRMPNLTVSPDFWAEDAFLFADAHNLGWHALFLQLGGFLKFYGHGVALIADHLPLSIAPTVFVYAAYAAILTVVFLASSPRFDFPHRELSAITVVAVPSAYELLGGLANTQWILPIGGFIILFCRPSTSRYVLIAEAVFVALMALDGPLGVYLLPLYLARAYLSSGAERHRLMILTSVLAPAAAIQFYTLLGNMRVFDLIPPAPYQHLLWLTMPLRWLETILPLNNFTDYGLKGAIAVTVLAAVFIALALKTPYRQMKVAMILFAASILYTGMYKFRANLGMTGDGFNPRYVYSGAIFFVWFVLLAGETWPRLRNAFVGAATFILAVNLLTEAFHERPRALEPWTQAVAPWSEGKTLKVQIAPQGWSITLAPTAWSVAVE